MFVVAVSALHNESFGSSCKMSSYIDSMRYHFHLRQSLSNNLRLFRGHLVATREFFSMKMQQIWFIQWNCLVALLTQWNEKKKFVAKKLLKQRILFFMYKGKYAHFWMHKTFGKKNFVALDYPISLHDVLLQLLLLLPRCVYFFIFLNLSFLVFELCERLHEIWWDSILHVRRLHAVINRCDGPSISHTHVIQNICILARFVHLFLIFRFLLLPPRVSHLQKEWPTFFCSHSYLKNSFFFVLIAVEKRSRCFTFFFIFFYSLNRNGFI